VISVIGLRPCLARFGQANGWIVPDDQQALFPVNPVLKAPGLGFTHFFQNKQPFKVTDFVRLFF